jgi:hypothetical protein
MESTAPAGRRFPERLRRVIPWTPLALATGLLAYRAIRGVLTKLGHPGAALDDAYIHFQYARAFAELHPFRFQAGEPISTGATSFLWPLLLAPFWAIGFRREAILWPSWALSFGALGGLAYEAYRLAKPLTGRGAAIGAAAMVLAFGGHAWCAASGMEVVPFAWLIASATRRAAEWAESTAARSKSDLRVLLAFAVACPLMRPEGAITSVALGLVVFAFPRARATRARAETLLFFAAALLPNLLLLLLTGSLTSSTAKVKLLVNNPYFSLSAASMANARVLVRTILDGEVWSAEFLPKGGSPLAILGLFAIAWRGHATKRGVRAGLVILLALSMFVPCTYVTFLWNRLRYLWPFATGWLIGLAALARAAGAVVGYIDKRAAPAAATLLAGAFAGALFVRLDWVLEDVAQSASGIDRQQSTLGRWAKANLPAGARIGVNDTGAIAYFGERKTFDVVGLTSPSEGTYWVAGAASRLEHYERLKKGSPSLLPTHFIVYPEWMACDPVLGRPLQEATVTDATILGGQTMTASEARWDHLDSGERPWSPLADVVDSVDVADLESEAAHGYELLGAHEGEQVVTESNAPDGAIVLDGARSNRTRDRFHVSLPPDGELIGIARVEGPPEQTRLHVRVAGRELAALEVPAGPWLELRFPIPSEARGPTVEIEVTADDGAFTSYHYWFGRPAPH